METCALVKEPSHPIRVLLVDDQEDVLWGLASLVEAERPRMSVAGRARDIAEALALARSRRPSVVVLDVFLGAVDSLEYLPQLLAAGAAQVLVLTSSEDTELHRRAIQRGAWAVVRKDEPAEVLLGWIERAHHGRQAGRRPR